MTMFEDYRKDKWEKDQRQKREERELFKNVIEKWGSEAQILMVLEEMSELSTNLCHHLRGRDVTNITIAEEIADVRLMLDQLEYVFNCDIYVSDFRKTKIKRLKERLQRNESI